MYPGLQAVLDQAVFDDSIPWDILEECFTMVRSGSELRDEVPEGNQWSNIRQLPPETLARSSATALRLTILVMVVLSRNKGQHAPMYNLPEEVRGDRFIGLQFHRVDPALIVNSLLVETPGLNWKRGQ
jgi:hypothetical protein